MFGKTCTNLTISVKFNGKYFLPLMVLYLNQRNFCVSDEISVEKHLLAQFGRKSEQNHVSECNFLTLVKFMFQNLCN